MVKSRYYNGIYLIFDADTELFFPDPGSAQHDIIAVGGTLSPERLLLGYRMGIFPWYSELPIQWFSPLKRFVIEPADLHLSTSLQKTIKKHPFHLTLDRDFRNVMLQCSTVYRPGQSGTWITEEMINAYCRLHEQGYAHSVEAWFDNELVGGLYGVSLGSVFYGESMFAKMSDASKVAFAVLATTLFRSGYEMIDCQVYTDNLARFGAKEIDRAVFLDKLSGLVDKTLFQKDWKQHLNLSNYELLWK